MAKYLYPHPGHALVVHCTTGLIDDPDLRARVGCWIVEFYTRRLLRDWCVRWEDADELVQDIVAEFASVRKRGGKPQPLRRFIEDPNMFARADNPYSTARAFFRECVRRALCVRLKRYNRKAEAEDGIGRRDPEWVGARVDSCLEAAETRRTIEAWASRLGEEWRPALEAAALIWAGEFPKDAIRAVFGDGENFQKGRNRYMSLRRKLRQITGIVGPGGRGKGRWAQNRESEGRKA